MKIRKSISALCFVFLMTLLFNYAHAAGFSLSHQILAVQPTQTGSDISINLTVTNNSSQKVSYLTVTAIDPAWHINTDASAKVTDSFAAGTSVNCVLLIHTDLQNVDPALPLNIHVFYVDANSAPVDTDIISVAK